MKDTNENIYKIVDTATGLYSTGGTWPTFNKKGKTWSKIGHVKAHLNQFEAIPDTWEIVEIEQRVCAQTSALDSFRPPDGKGYRSKLNPALFPMGNPNGPYQVANSFPVVGKTQFVQPMTLQQALMGPGMIGNQAGMMKVLNMIGKTMIMQQLPLNTMPAPIIKRMNIKKKP